DGCPPDAQDHRHLQHAACTGRASDRDSRGRVRVAQPPISRPDTATTSRLGNTRVTTRATKALAAPSTKLGLRPDSARIVASTTCCGLRVTAKAAEPDAAVAAASPANSKNGVSVSPGHTAMTRTPCLRSSAQSASVKDNTKA